MSKITMAEIGRIVADAFDAENMFKRLTELRWRSTSDDVDDRRLGALADKVNNLRERLLAETNSLARNLEQIARRLGEKRIGYHGLNSLGELQARGPAYDVLVALYCAAYEELNHELCRREGEERDAEYQVVKQAMTTQELNLFCELGPGSKTIKQLAAATKYTVTQVEDLVSGLMAKCLVTRSERYVIGNSISQWDDARKREAAKKLEVQI